MAEFKKEDRIWIIVKEKNRKVNQANSTPQNNKITIHQSPGSKRALSL